MLLAPREEDSTIPGNRGKAMSALVFDLRPWFDSEQPLSACQCSHCGKLFVTYIEQVESAEPLCRGCRQAPQLHQRPVLPELAEFEFNSVVRTALDLVHQDALKSASQDRPWDLERKVQALRARLKVASKKIRRRGDK